jgi:hypothetical protein
VCNVYNNTMNQEANRALFRVINRYVGNLAPMPGVFPDFPAPSLQAQPSRRAAGSKISPNDAPSTWWPGEL